MIDYQTAFASGYKYDDFLARYGTEQHRAKWQAMHDRIQLTPAQQQLLGTFKREMPVLVLAGAWCGDCVDQCPIYDHFARVASVIKLRFLDRDEGTLLAPHVKICGGARVPSVVFLSEDFQEVARYGDRTLARYREINANSTGEACSTGLGGDVSVQAQVIQEWLDQFERAQLILRTSPRLRQKHGD
jgi:thiol-disulfide isomerase/thioredoxin